MHLHGVSANPYLGSLEAADAAQRTANAQRAANTRKELAQVAAQNEAEAQLEELLLDGDAYKKHQEGQQPDDESVSDAESPAGQKEESDEHEHKSFWA